MATNQMRREAAKRKLERQQQRRAEQAKKRQRTVVITVVGVVVVVAALIVVLVTLPSGGSQPPADAAATPTSDAAPTTDPAAAKNAATPASIPTALTPLPTRATPLPATVDCAYKPAGQASKPNTAPAGTGVSAQGTTTLTLTTNDGAIPLTLDKALAPCTVNSMVSLATQGYFDNTTCHRLTTSPGLQVLQCGDPTGQGTGGPGYTVPDELVPGQKYGRGLLAMANTGQPDTGGSQFFVLYGDGSGLDSQPNYTIFGQVSAEGLQVLDTIAKRGQDQSMEPSPGGGKPVQPVTIQKAAVS